MSESDQPNAVDQSDQCDKKESLPLRVAPFSKGGRLCGDIKYGDMVINIRKPKNPEYIDATVESSDEPIIDDTYCSLM